VRRNPKVLLGLLMRASAEALLKLGRDPKRLGAQLDVTAVLHRWTRTLLYHPHVHCIVTGGGLSLDEQSWVATRPNHLFPVRVLGRVFRGLFMAKLRELYERGELNLVGECAEMASPDIFKKFKEALYDQDWVTYAKQPFGGPKQVFAYLGRYTHRVGISNSRLRSVTSEAVTFTTKLAKTTTMTPAEFMRRFLLHVLPRGFVKIRHYGIMAGRNVSGALTKAQLLLRADECSSYNSQDGDAVLPIATDGDSDLLVEGSWQAQLLFLTGIDIEVCTRCRARAVVRHRLPARNTS
jgi:hypothetical protein